MCHVSCRGTSPASRRLDCKTFPYLMVLHATLPRDTLQIRSTRHARVHGTRAQTHCAPSPSSRTAVDDRTPPGLQPQTLTPTTVATTTDTVLTSPRPQPLQLLSLSGSEPRGAAGGAAGGYAACFGAAAHSWAPHPSSVASEQAPMAVGAVAPCNPAAGCCGSSGSQRPTLSATSRPEAGGEAVPLAEAILDALRI